VIEDKAIETEYDGSQLHMSQRDNDHISQAVIKDKELGKLLTKPSSKINLIERLKQDLKKMRSRSKRSRSKRSRSKRKRSRSKRKRSRSKRSKKRKSPI
jgi:hypothetical protein